eukprot:SM000062S19881  [mRNA]  locus=s62:127886:130131:- [translate_table: standard]
MALAVVSSMAVSKSFLAAAPATRGAASSGIHEGLRSPTALGRLANSHASGGGAARVHCEAKVASAASFRRRSRLGPQVAVGSRGLFLEGTGLESLASRTKSMSLFKLALVLEQANCLQAARGGALSMEMSIFSRVARIVRATVEGFVGRNEDPEKLLEQASIEMTNDVAKLRQTLGQVMASKSMIERRYTAAQAASDEWYRKARRALEVGEEELAKEALKRRKTVEESAASLKLQLDQQRTVANKIQSSTRALEAKVAEARSKKDILQARAQSAKTSKFIGEVLGSVDTSSALAAYQRMEEKVERLEAEADSLTQVASDDLQTRFAMLEADSVDGDLAALKREVGPTQARLELPPWEERTTRSIKVY